MIATATVTRLGNEKPFREERLWRLAAAVALALVTAPSAHAYDFYKTITIDRSKIPGSCGTTLANFPMLFSVTDPDLAHTSSGGDVTDVGGDDIIFHALDAATCGGTAPCVLDHEIERYVSTTGELVAWVRVPSVNTAAAGSDTVIRVIYGDSTVTTPTENPSGVWDANHVGVWHLKEGTGVTAVDSTSNNNSAVPNSGNPTSDIGQIGGALRFASTSRLRIAAAASLDLSSGVTPDWTMSAWVRPTSYTTSWPTIYAYGSYRASMGLSQIEAGTDGRIENWTNDVVVLESNSAVVLNAWHYVTVTRTAATTTFYMNGSPDGSSGPSPVSTLTNQVSGIGSDGNGAIDATEQFLGLIDEVRVSNTARSSCWVAASYNNEVWPDKAVTPSPSPSPNPSSGFYTIGAPTAVQLASFSARGLDGSVELLWETGSELDNLGFHLYRSTSASGPFERITASLIPGLGSSPEGARYRYVDASLENGVAYYYELEDVETTGRVERHGPVTAVPTAGAGVVPEERGEASAAASVITYGDPEGNGLRVVKRGRHQVLLELTTAGFYAYPEPDGSVRIALEDFVDGEEGLPLKRAWIEALSGRQVELVSVRTREVETLGLRPSGASESVAVATRDGVVHLRRSGGGELSVASKDTDAARIEDVAFQGEVKKALIAMSPFFWDASRSELRLAKRLYVTLSFTKPDRSEVAFLYGRRGRRERKGSRPVEGGVVARLGTKEPGLYVVTYEELFGRAHRGRGVLVSSLRLSRLGEPVPFHVEPSGSRFASGSTLYFVSAGAKENPYGDEAVYELTTGISGGEAMAVWDATTSSPSSSERSWYVQRDDHERNVLYQAALMESKERWMWEALFAPVTRAYGFHVEALATAMEARLEVWLQGGSDFPASPDHHVRVRVNGALVAERSWNGKLGESLDVALDPGVLREGENTLELENVGDTEAAYSMVYLDHFAVSYARHAHLSDGVLTGTWKQTGTATVEGVSASPVLLDVTEDGAPVWAKGASSSGDRLHFTAASEHRYLVVDATGVKRPEVRQASGAWSWLLGESSRADLVLIGPAAFIEAARPLMDHRRAQGLTTLGVPLEGIYETYGFGESRPEAIRDFLSHAYHHWRAPSLRYVLLLGDGTYDYKNVYGLQDSNRVPPLMVATRAMWTASDPTYAAVNGDDRLPDLAIGRLPAKSVDELRAMVEKILAYEAGASTAWEAPVILVSDDADAAGDFDADAKRLAQTVLASEGPRHISLQALGPTEARRQVVEAFDEGAYLVSYMGHGGIWLWADENLLDVSSVATLSPQPPERQPLVLTMNCLNGYFQFPFVQSLSEALVASPDKGAIAAFSPSGLSVNGPARRYHEALLTEVFHGGHERLGDAIMAAQARYADSGALPELLIIYHLLGDPTTILRR